MLLLNKFLFVLGSQLLLLVLNGFIFAAIGIAIYLIVWKKLNIEIEHRKVFFLLNLCAFFCGTFVSGFMFGLSPAFDKSTLSVFDSLEQELIITSKAQSADDKVIDISTLQEVSAFKKRAKHSLQSFLPADVKVEESYLFSFIPGGHFYLRAEKAFEGQSLTSPKELRRFICQEVKKRLLFFLPELPILVFLTPFGLLGLTIYISRSDKKLLIEMENAKKENRILL